MSINEKHLLSLVKGAPTVVRADDGSLTLVFQNEAISPWKLSIPLTTFRAETKETVLNGSVLFVSDIPGYIIQHLSELESIPNGNLFTIKLSFRGSSSPESRYTRKAVEKFLHNRAEDISLSREGSCITIVGTATAINTIFKSLGEKGNERYIKWTASTLLNESLRQSSGLSRERGLN